MVRKSCNMFVIDVCIIHSSTTDACHLSTLRHCLIPILIQSSIKFLLTSGCSHDGSAMHCKSTNPPIQLQLLSPGGIQLSQKNPFQKEKTPTNNPKSRSTSPSWNRKISNPSIPLSDSKLGRSVGVRSSKKRRLYTIRLGVLPPMVFLMIFLDLKVHERVIHMCINKYIDIYYYIYIYTQ